MRAKNLLRELAPGEQDGISLGIKLSENLQLTALRAQCDIKYTARGPSGRVVIELDPDLKRELHGSLVADGSNLKEWFIAQARAYLRHRRAPDLPGLADINQD